MVFTFRIYNIFSITNSNQIKFQINEWNKKLQNTPFKNNGRKIRLKSSQKWKLSPNIRIFKVPSRKVVNSTKSATKTKIKMKEMNSELLDLSQSLTTSKNMILNLEKNIDLMTVCPQRSKFKNLIDETAK